VFWTLFLAHLLGDYPLQTDEMARAKRYWPGLLRHVTVHLLVLLLMAGMASATIWPYLLALAAAHFAIDALKNFNMRRWPGRVFSMYLLDQGLHMLSLLLAARWIVAATGVARDRPWMVYAAAYLLATHVWFITERVMAGQRRADPAVVEAGRWWRVGVRALALTVYLLLGRAFLGQPQVGLPLAGLAIAGLPLVGLAAGERLGVFPYGSSRRQRQLLVVDLLVPLAAAVLVLWAV
jgi:hypothetical protein